jgi:hypothetical protein
VGTRNGLARAVAYGLLVSGLAGVALPVRAQQPANPEKNLQLAESAAEPRQTSVPEPAQIETLPDSPGANLQKAAGRIFPVTHRQPQDAASPRLVLAQNQPSQPDSPQSSSAQSNPGTSPDAQKPVGTAAAEAPHATGVAASQPAGVAIAPAKQHRVRTIVIRVGVIVGAGVAVGTVVGLTEATSSKPPGAH